MKVKRLVLRFHPPNHIHPLEFPNQLHPLRLPFPPFFITYSILRLYLPVLINYCEPNHEPYSFFLIKTLHYPIPTLRPSILGIQAKG